MEAVRIGSLGRIGLGEKGRKEQYDDKNLGRKKNCEQSSSFRRRLGLAALAGGCWWLPGMIRSMWFSRIMLLQLPECPGGSWTGGSARSGQSVNWIG